MSRGGARHSMADYAVASHARGVSDGDRRMERYHEYVGRRRAERTVWPGAAFIVEALLLLVFLTGSLAVLMQLNADADIAGEQSADLMGAMTLASNAAEEFAIDPAAFEEAYAADPMGDRWLSQPVDSIVSGEEALSVECTFSVEETGAGALHHVTLEVRKVRVLTDPDQMWSEGIVVDKPGGYCFEYWHDEPVYVLDTTCYVPAADDAASREEVAHG